VSHEYRTRKNPAAVDGLNPKIRRVRWSRSYFWGPMTHCEQAAIPRNGALTTRLSTSLVRQSGDRAHAIPGGWRG
jgi:hypothetical protein